MTTLDRSGLCRADLLQIAAIISNASPDFPPTPSGEVRRLHEASPRPGHAAATLFDGDAGLRPALNLADAFALILAGADGHRCAQVRRESDRLGCPQELKAHIRGVSNPPVEAHDNSTQQENHDG